MIEAIGVDPVDELIIRLAGDQSIRATPTDGPSIVARMQVADFNSAKRSAAQWSKLGTDVVGEPHPANAGQRVQPETLLTSLEVHTAKRVKERRWMVGTTPTQYLADLHAGATAATMLQVGQYMPDAARPTAATLSAVRGGGGNRVLPDPQRQTMVVFYDARGGCLDSGYTVSPSERVALFKAWRNPRKLSVK